MKQRAPNITEIAEAERILALPRSSQGHALASLTHPTVVYVKAAIAQLQPKPQRRRKRTEAGLGASVGRVL